MNVIVALLQEADTLRVPGEKTVAFLCKENRIREATSYSGYPQNAGGKKFGGLQTGDVQRLKELAKENARLKRLLAERILEND